MSDKKYVVPEGMIDAVVAQSCRGRVFDSALVRKDLEAAIRWLAEHPPILDDGQWASCWSVAKLPEGYDMATFSRCMLKKMFLSVVPEIPEEVRPLLRMDITGD